MKITREGSRLKVSGVVESPLHLYDASEIDLDIVSNHPVFIEKCSRVTIKADIKTKARCLTICNSRDIEVRESRFDASGSDADAVMVCGQDVIYSRPGTISTTPYDRVWGEGVAFSTDRITYGHAIYAQSHLQWHETVSFRTKKVMAAGYDNEYYSDDIRFLGCTFRDAKRAGLFIHHCHNPAVCNCKFEQSFEKTEADLSLEWTTGAYVFEASAPGTGIFTHYRAENTRIEKCEAKAIRIMSNGEPVINTVLYRNKAKFLEFCPGQLYDFRAAAWIKGVRVVGGEYGAIVIDSGQVGSGQPPEVLISDVEVIGPVINWDKSIYPVALRTMSVDGFSQANVEFKNGGWYQDFSVGGRVPTSNKS